MQERLIKGLIVGAVFFWVGYYTCILFKKYSVLSIDEQVAIEVNPFDIISAGITVLLAFYVTRVLGKKNGLREK
jgi:hypothetical protein